ADERNQQVAEDWLTMLSQRSEEALAARAAEKKVEKPVNEKALIEALARKGHTEYDKLRAGVADTLGIRVGTLDEKVEAIRKKRSKKDAPAAPPIDAAKAKAEAGDLVTCPNILERFASVITKAGLVGETNNAKILYLALTSRLFDRPLSTALKGVSSGGKSFT